MIDYFSTSFRLSADTPNFGSPKLGPPKVGLSFASTGSMKVLRDDVNRASFFSSVGIDVSSVVSLTQTHSKTVHIADCVEDFRDLPEGDGILTVNPSLVPCVTVADCMPIWLFDPVTSFFGVLHSGWQGTGILAAALKAASDAWGARSRDISVILGPHIRSCCYTVDESRADYFRSSFTPSCVYPDEERMASGSRWPWRLSLAEANRSLCLDLGIKPDHILDTGECTSCDTRFGSHRREGSASFNQMAAFIRR